MTRIITIAATLSLVAFIGCKKDEAADSKAPEPAAEKATAEVQPEAAEPVKAETADETKVGSLSADELDALIKEGTVAVLDSNGDKTRKEFGKIPTATLLSSSSDYELSELPEDKAKKLVFYCSNTQCGASKKSATKAMAAGYSDVNILPVGVIGWKESGKTTEKAL